MPRLINHLYANKPTPEENYTTNQIAPLVPAPPAIASPSAQAVQGTPPIPPPTRADVTNASKALPASTATSAATLLSYRNALEQEITSLVSRGTDIYDVCNQHYVGFGNPDAKILILGKEVAFTPATQSTLCVDESINNTLQWEWVHEQGIRFDYDNDRFVDGNGNTITDIQSMIGFNPFFPVEGGYYTHRNPITGSNTWGKYANLVNAVFGISTCTNYNRYQSQQAQLYGNFFFSRVFISEISISPRPSSNGQVSPNQNLSDLIQHFDVVIAACGDADYWTQLCNAVGLTNLNCTVFQHAVITPHTAILGVWEITLNNKTHLLILTPQATASERQFATPSPTNTHLQDIKQIITGWLTAQGKTVDDLLPIPRKDEVLDLLATYPNLYEKLKNNKTLAGLWPGTPPNTIDVQFYEDIVKKNPLILQFAHVDMTSMNIPANGANGVLQWIQSSFSSFTSTAATLQSLADDCKQYQPIALAAVQKNGLNLAHVAPELKSGLGVVKVAVGQNGLALEFASATLKDGANVVEAAVKKNGLALEFASARLQSDSTIVKLAVEKNGLALQFASDGLKGDAEVVKEAVGKNGLALQFADATALQTNPNTYQTIVKAAVKQNGLALQFAPTLQGDRTVVKPAVKQNGLALQFAPTLQNCPTVVKPAVGQNGLALQFADPTLKGTQVIVEKAVKQNGLALQFAPTLQNCPTVVAAALKQNILAVQFANLASLDWSNNNQALNNYAQGTKKNGKTEIKGMMQILDKEKDSLHHALKAAITANTHFDEAKKDGTLNTLGANGSFSDIANKVFESA